MCELFGMSASQPVPIRRELEEFRLRGGMDADNPDGWGLDWREKESFQLAKEPLPAFRSALFEYLCATLNSSLSPLAMTASTAWNRMTARPTAS
ncbi:MAG: class II glutamine amidotransferase [Sulfurimicrobium sp.]